MATDPRDPAYLAAGSIECPQCHTLFAWLGDHGASIELFHRCLKCELDQYPTPFESPEQEREADGKVEWVMALREERERHTGRRVFPCITCASLPESTGCKMCGGRGWILGYPPGYLPPG